MGVRDSELTGLTCPNLNSTQDLVRHIDSFSVDYHLGTLTSLYQQFNLPSKNYSPELITYYLNQTLKDRPRFQLGSEDIKYLTITDLIIKRHTEEKYAFGLEAIIKPFIHANDEDGAQTFVIPVFLQAKWLLITVNKVFKQIYVFSSPSQPQLLNRLLTIIQQSVPENFTVIERLFSPQISPIYYGAIIVEIVRKLSNNELYDEVLETKNEQLKLIYQSQIELFKPKLTLLSPQQAMLTSAINPSLTNLFALHLLDILYRKYPGVALSGKLVDLKISKEEIYDIGYTLLTTETPYRLHQALCNEDLLKLLFQNYQEAKQGLKLTLQEHRRSHELSLSANLTIAAKQQLVAHFNDETLVEQFSKDIVVQDYGNWFSSLNIVDFTWGGEKNGTPWDERGQRHATNAAAKASFLKKQRHQIQNFKQSFSILAKNRVSKFDIKNIINLYDGSNTYIAKLMPWFLIPEQQENPILPNHAFMPSDVPLEILQAQALNIGHLELRYNINIEANKFTVTFCFVMEKYGSGSCFKVYTIPYKNDDPTLNFYTGQEGVWWFWNGGSCPSQKEFPRHHADISLDGYIYNYYIAHSFPLPEVNITGVGLSPLSSPNYTKVFNIEDSPQHPLAIEIIRHTAEKYKEMRQTLNQKLTNEINNPVSNIGKAVLKFELSHRILSLFLEFIFPNSLHNTNSSLYSLMHHSGSIYNKSELLEYLSSQTKDYVTSSLVQNVTLELARNISLALLPTQAHSHILDLDELQQELLNTYDDFIPFQRFNETPIPGPDLDDKLKFAELEISFRSWRTIMSDNIIMHIINSPPGSQGQFATEQMHLIQMTDNIFKSVKEKFNSGEIPYSEVLRELQQTAKLALPPPPATDLKAIAEIRYELSIEEELELFLKKQTKQKPPKKTTSSWLLPGAAAISIPAVADTPASWFDDNPNLNSEIKHTEQPRANPNSNTFTSGEYVRTIVHNIDPFISLLGVIGYKVYNWLTTPKQHVELLSAQEFKKSMNNLSNHLDMIVDQVDRVSDKWTKEYDKYPKIVAKEIKFLRTTCEDFAYDIKQLQKQKHARLEDIFELNKDLEYYLTGEAFVDAKERIMYALNEPTSSQHTTTECSIPFYGQSFWAHANRQPQCLSTLKIEELPDTPTALIT